MRGGGGGQVPRCGQPRGMIGRSKETSLPAARLAPEPRGSTGGNSRPSYGPAGSVSRSTRRLGPPPRCRHAVRRAQRFDERLNRNRVPTAHSDGHWVPGPVRIMVKACRLCAGLVTRVSADYEADKPSQQCRGEPGQYEWNRFA